MFSHFVISTIWNKVFNIKLFVRFRSACYLLIFLFTLHRAETHMCEKCWSENAYLLPIFFRSFRSIDPVTLTSTLYILPLLYRSFHHFINKIIIGPLGHRILYNIMFGSFSIFLALPFDQEFTILKICISTDQHGFDNKVTWQFGQWIPLLL